MAFMPTYKSVLWTFSWFLVWLSVYLPKWVTWYKDIKSNGNVVFIWSVFLFPISRVWYNLILPLRKISHLLSSFYKTKASWDRLIHVLPMNGVSLKVCLKRIGQTLICLFPFKTPRIKCTFSYQPVHYITKNINDTPSSKSWNTNPRFDLVVLTN